MKTTSIVFALIALVILTGCTSTTVHLRPDLTFQTKDSKLRKSVSISISTDTKNYVLKSKAGVGTWTVPIGQALEPNALRAFAAVIEKATAYTGDTAADRIIELSFDPQTDIRLGGTTFSENKCIIVLKCDIKDSTGKVVWSGTAHGEASKNISSGYMCLTPLLLIGGIFIQNAYNAAIGNAADAAMMEALQKLADQVKAQKQSIF